MTLLLLDTPDCLVPARQTRTPGALIRLRITSTSSRVLAPYLSMEREQIVV